MWIAWLSVRGTSSAQAGSLLHLTSGFGSVAASTLASIASWPMVDRTCCPAVITSGVCEYTELVREPIALPVPDAACRLTNAGSPAAWAYPSAIDSTAPSWRPST